MKNIKIFLQRPWKVSDSSYYKYLNEGLPRGIEYVNLQDKKNKGIITSSKEFWKNQSLKRKVKNFFRNFKFPYPNAHFTRNSHEYDLIHCAHCLSWNRTKPWICDIEYADQFYVGNKSKLLKKIVRRILLRKNCVKIMPWSKWSEKNILKEFPELKDKIEIIYPALPLNKVKRNYGRINLLFVGREFVGKGGEIALEVMDYLTKKYKNVYGTMITEILEDKIKKYRKNKKIKILDLVPQEKLFKEIYPNGDIFLYPTRSDTLGFAILEAQSFGIPVIATKTKSTHTINETISDGKTGFIVKGDVSAWSGENEKEKNRIVMEIVKRTEKLIKDKKLLKKMSGNCFKEFKDGKFSVKERNGKLRKIFDNLN